MNKISYGIKKVSLLVVVILCILLLTGCKYVKNKKAETKEILTEFLNYIKEDNRTKVYDLLHPDSSLTGNLNSTLAIIESTCDIDLSDEIIIGDVISFEMTKYNGNYGGETCEIVYDATSNGKDITIYIFTLNNDKAFGIYKFDIDKK